MNINQQICRGELEHHGLTPRKYHGQVFTTDETVIGQLIAAIQSIYRPGTKIVEIGGGLGYITDALLQHFDDIDCVELDDALFGLLSKKFAQKNSLILNKNFVLNENSLNKKQKIENLNKKFIQNIISEKEILFYEKYLKNKKIVQEKSLRLIKADILDYKIPKKDYLLVGNIPFHISGKLYRKFMSDIEHKPYGMVFITDKQYAKTLMGQPPRCYRVSLQAQSYGDIEIVADVPPTSVYPEPKVMSCIMKITYNPTPLPQNFWPTVNYHFENFPTAEVQSPKTLGLKDWIGLCEKKQNKS